MSYQALARKYRPRRFADMVGQEPVVRTLTNALSSGRVHHAYVFSGIRGIGKTTSARLLARALNCEKGPTPDPCGACPACAEIAEGRSIDAVEIDAASNRGIDEIKGLIQSAQYAPSRDRHKVYVVDEFHMLTREAFNALLKTLEEPPPHVVFILATTELEKVPETILSRCLLLNFRAVPLPTLRAHLLDIAARESVSLDAAAADLIARKAGGSVRDAQSTLDRVIALAGTTITRELAGEVLGVVDASTLRRALGACLDGDASDALAVVQQVAESGADPQGFLDDLLAEARAALLVSVLADARPTLGLPEADLEEVAAVAQRATSEDLRRVVDRLLESGPRLRTASEPRYFLEALVVRLAHLTRLEPLVDLIARLDGAGGTAAPVPAPSAASAPRPGPPPSPPRSGRPPAGASAPSESPAKPAVPGPPAPAAGTAGKSSSWRERLSSGAGPTDGEDDEEDEAPPQRRQAPVRAGVLAAPRAAAPIHPLAAFRSGLPARVRGHVDHALLRSDGDGLAVVLPKDRASVADHLGEQRFHLVAAAAEAFGRPVPVRVVLEDGVLAAAAAPGEIEGIDFSARRMQVRAGAHPSVRAVLQRFDGRVTGVHPEPPLGA